MSERLTARSPKNGMAYLVNVKDDEQALDGRYNTLLCVRDAFEKLAMYEETGLSPSDIPKLKTENAKLKIQIEKVLEAIGEGVPCPNVVDLPVTVECGNDNCKKCWIQALESVEVSEPHPDGPLYSPEITEMHKDGMLCERCGEHIGEPGGRARECKGCED